MKIRREAGIKKRVALVPNANTPLGTWQAGNRSRTPWFGQYLLSTLPEAEYFDGVKMMTFVKTFLRDESGASAAEYALILAVVGAGIAFAAFALGEAVGDSINGATNVVIDCAAGSGTIASDCTA